MRSSIRPELLNLFDTAPRKGEILKAKIVEAAIDCISREGIEKLTFESIGKRIGIRKSHVAYHFKQKEDLILLVIKYIFATGQSTTVQELQKAKTPEEQIERYVGGALLWAETYRQQACVVGLFHHYCTFNPKYQEFNARMREAGIERVFQVLSSLPNKNSELSEDDLRMYARQAQGLVAANVLYVITSPRQSKAKLRKLRSEVAQSILKWVNWPTSGGRT